MVVGGRGRFAVSSRFYESALQEVTYEEMLTLLCEDLCRDYPLKMSVSDLPSDIALGENLPEPNKDSYRLKSLEVPRPSSQPCARSFTAGETNTL
ncbi:hypothetical protein TNCV_832641 [Trichonephila clavipes]|nr:hypothetical protein TNCV_832641 [Trichonephila clavipes]